MVRRGNCREFVGKSGGNANFARTRGGGAAFLRKNFHVQEIYALATVFGLSLLIISSWFDIS